MDPAGQPVIKKNRTKFCCKLVATQNNPMQRNAFIRNTAALATGLLALNPKDMLAALLQQPAWKIKMLTDNFEANVPL